MSDQEPSDLEIINLVETAQARLLGTMILVNEEVERTARELGSIKNWLRKRAAEPPPAGEGDQTDARH